MQGLFFCKRGDKTHADHRGWTLIAQSQAYCSITGLDPHNKNLPWVKGPPAIRFVLHVEIECGPPTLPPVFAMFLVCCCVLFHDDGEMFSVYVNTNTVLSQIF